MVLFSSFSHFNILLLFAYLGLASGVVFYLVYYLAHFIKIRQNNTKQNIKSSTKREENVDNFKTLKIIKQKKEELKKLTKAQREAYKKDIKQKILYNKNIKAKHRKEKIISLFKSFYKNVKIVFKKTQNVILEAICCATLIFVAIGSYYINFVLNYGQVRIIYILVWAGCFLLVGSIAKKVANLFLNFYNKRNKKQTNQNNK